MALHHTTIRLEKSAFEEIEQLATQLGQPTSQLLRNLVMAGLRQSEYDHKHAFLVEKLDVLTEMVGRVSSYAAAAVSSSALIEARNVVDRESLPSGSKRYERFQDALLSHERSALREGAILDRAFQAGK
jgi:hypothetical protein